VNGPSVLVVADLEDGVDGRGRPLEVPDLRRRLEELARTDGAVRGLNRDVCVRP